MKIGVIGAGVSGMSIARLLQKSHEVVLMEKNPVVGGIARARNINGVPYPIVGGHCMNSINPKVLEFVFSILPENQWHKVDRNSVIAFKGHEIPYPIEFAIQDIFSFDKELAFRCTLDFFNTSEQKPSSNLEEWFINKFGETLAKEYFIPYNRKIWGMDLKEIDPAWVDGKLPIPNKAKFFSAMFASQSDGMPHAQFYYPNSNNQNTFLEALSEGLNILRDYPVKSIKKSGNQWLVNDSLTFDLIINTMPLKELPSVINSAPKDVQDAAEKLRFQPVTNMLWETKPVGDKGWTYYPGADTFVNKNGHIGNFMLPKKQTFSTMDVVGYRSKESMIEEGKKFGHLLKPLDYHTSEYAYVVYDKNYSASVNLIRDYLSKIGIYTLGRFGEWVYYNMDMCIESAMRLAEEINSISNPKGQNAKTKPL